MTPKTVLIDTDVASYFFKQDSRAGLFKPYLEDRTIAVSFITVGELYFWAVKNLWGPARIRDLDDKIKNFVLLPNDHSVCYQYAFVRNQCERSGLPINYPDYWVAACALRYNCALATNNVSHYCNIKGLELIIPGQV